MVAAQASIVEPGRVGGVVAVRRAVLIPVSYLEAGAVFPSLGQGRMEAAEVRTQRLALGWG